MFMAGVCTYVISESQVVVLVPIVIRGRSTTGDWTLNVLRCTKTVKELNTTR